MMVSSFAKSIALASALYVSPTSLAFTTSTTSHRGARPSTFTTSTTSRRGARPSMFLCNAAAAGDEDGAGRPRRSSLASSSQEEQINQNDVDLSPLDVAPSELGVDSEPRSSEFGSLEPRAASAARLSRLDSEALSQSVYVRSGSDAYWDLQDEISQLEEDLAAARDAGVSDDAEEAIRSMLRRAQAKDPMHVHKVIGEAARSAESRGDVEASERYKEESLRVRKMLPQFNLEGLWVGKYGSHGFEMINVTYSGDVLVAYKVTGNKSIPRGEVSFTADLSSHADDGVYSTHNQQPSKPLEPIRLSESSAEKWGTRRLPRFPGEGHVAEPGFVNHQLQEGQLVVIGNGNYFSFVWVPLEHQIFFSRPSPEQMLKMQKEAGGSQLTAGLGLDVPGEDAGMKEMVEYAGRCWEVTSNAAWDEFHEGKLDPFSCIWHGDDEHCYFE